MSLIDLQQDFRAFLLDAPVGIDEQLGEHARLGLPVYHHAYRAQLVAALRDSFERLHAWLGDEAFDAAAMEHVKRNPPTSWTLGDYGMGFDATLAERYPADPEVPELAALDWALRRAFDGPDCAPLEPARLAAADWDCAVLQFVPTLSFVPISTNCALIWNAIAGNEDVPPAEMLPAPATIRVWRSGLEPHFKTIEALETAALNQCLRGVPFAKVCDELASAGGVADSVETAGALLRSWLEDGLIRALS